MLTTEKLNEKTKDLNNKTMAFDTLKRGTEKRIKYLED